MNGLSLRPRPGQTRCPLCRQSDRGATVGCSACATRYHRECLVELTGCAVLGCGGELPGVRPPRLETRAVARGWECERGHWSHLDERSCGECEALWIAESGESRRRRRTEPSSWGVSFSEVLSSLDVIFFIFIVFLALFMGALGGR